MREAEETRDVEIFTFPNGIRLIHKQVSSTKVAHCGFVLDIGSRDEQPEHLGVAHFWEHMAFKGTTKRKAYHILSRVDSVGGELNAYTTKEKICFYASLLDLHFEKAVELLTDITFHSTFPEKEIQKERGVILEEMSMYLDDPADAIQDEFDEVIFGSHPLGSNILGTRDTISQIRKQDFLDFIAQNLDTERIVFSSVSSMPFKKVLRIAERFLADLPKRSAERKRVLFSEYQPKQLALNKPINQAHCIIGTTTYSIFQMERIPFFLLVNLLGGPGMNSRLNLSVREKFGFVYNIDANTNSFQDTGLFSIHFATEHKTLDRCIALVMKELRKLRDQKLGSMQLHSAKQQLMGQMAMAEESNLGLMLMMGKSMLDLGKVDTLGRIFQKISEIEADTLLELANDKLAEDRLSMLTYLPESSKSSLFHQA